MKNLLLILIYLTSSLIPVTCIVCATVSRIYGHFGFSAVLILLALLTLPRFHS